MLRNHTGVLICLLAHLSWSFWRGCYKKTVENSIRNHPPFSSSVNKQPGSFFFFLMPLVLILQLILGRTQGQHQTVYNWIQIWGWRAVAEVGKEKFILFSATCHFLSSAFKGESKRDLRGQSRVGIQTLPMRDALGNNFKRKQLKHRTLMKTLRRLVLSSS